MKLLIADAGSTKTDFSFTTVDASCDATIPISEITPMIPMTIAKITIPMTVARVYLRNSFIVFFLFFYNVWQR